MKDDVTDGRTQYDVIHDNVGNQPLRRLRRALTPAGTLVTNAGGSPGHVFDPIAGILRVIALNAIVPQRLRPLPDAWTREHLHRHRPRRVRKAHAGRLPDLSAGRHSRRPALPGAGTRARQGRHHRYLSRALRSMRASEKDKHDEPHALRL